MPDFPQRVNSARYTVMFVTFPGRQGGPQAWFSQLESHPGFTSTVDARTWKPGDFYRGLCGKFKLLRHCRSNYEKAGRPRIVYVSLDLDFAAQIVLGLRLAGAQDIIVHAHATRFGTGPGVKTVVYKLLVRVLVSRKVAVAENAARAMFGQSLGQVKLLPAFIDFDALRQNAENNLPAESVHSGFECKKSFVYACIGRLAESKNLELAIEAFARLKKDTQDPDIELLLIGSGPEEQSLKRKCSELEVAENVHVTGWVDNVAWYLRNVVDCVLMPSVHEGAPRSILEAQAFGCSVIVSEAVPEFCLFREDLATRLTKLDAEIWAREMERVARAGKKTVGNSIEIARQHPLFSIDHGIEEFLDLLKPSKPPDPNNQ